VQDFPQASRKKKLLNSGEWLLGLELGDRSMEPMDMAFCSFFGFIMWGGSMDPILQGLLHDGIVYYIHSSRAE
jgi:hypothetical protein